MYMETNMVVDRGTLDIKALRETGAIKEKLVHRETVALKEHRDRLVLQDWKVLRDRRGLLALGETKETKELKVQLENQAHPGSLGCRVLM